MKVNHSGHRVAITPPALKQNAPSACTDGTKTKIFSRRRLLLDQIENHQCYADEFHALSDQQRDNLPAGAKLAYRIHEAMLPYYKQELADLEAAEANHEEGTI